MTFWMNCQDSTSNDWMIRRAARPFARHSETPDYMPDYEDLLPR